MEKCKGENMKYISGVLGVGLVVLFYCGTVQAASVSISEDFRNSKYVDSISTFTTTGNTMNGMEVVVDLGNTQETVYWNAGGNNTGALGTGWSLTMTDYNTSTYALSDWWIFDSTTANVESITLNGFDYNVLFDDDKQSYPGTPGSARGRQLAIDYINLPITTYDGVIDVEYYDAVGLNGGLDPQNPFGDLYQSMTISFMKDNNGALISGAFTPEDTFAFYQDTDNITNPVPEPSTMILFGFGLIGVAGFLRSRRG